MKTIKKLFQKCIDIRLLLPLLLLVAAITYYTTISNDSCDSEDD